ncbi:class I SAM-dependent methyltransferase [Candidatus Pacearchaeota archaeon]|nr:class I SAM-dependent methyltransferase [Candidatus Pacearchaeota archaeon]
MMKDKFIYDSLYKKDKAPWTSNDIPTELSNLIKDKIILPCNALDIGCGEGHYPIYLASNGFKVTGIDISKEAINRAKQNAKNAKVSCKFLVMDYKNLNELKDKFGFILDWRFLHGIIKEADRKTYVRIINNILNEGGKYLSVSFSDQTKCWGYGKIRKTPVGTLCYFASKEKLEKLFRPHFKILDEKIIQLSSNKEEKVFANYFLMEKL